MKRKVLNAEAVRGMSIWDRLWWFATGSLPEKCLIEVDDGKETKTARNIPGAILYPFELTSNQVKEVASKALYPEKKRNVLSREEFLKRVDLSPLGIKELWSYQREAFLNSGEGNVFYRWGRRTGKNVILLLETLYRVHLGKNNLLFVGFNSEDGKKMKETFKTLLLKNRFVLELGEDVLVDSISSKNSLDFHGRNCDLVILNEPQYFREREFFYDYCLGNRSFIVAATMMECDMYKKYMLPPNCKTLFCPSNKIPGWEIKSKDMMNELSPAEFKKEFLIGDI